MTTQEMRELDVHIWKSVFNGEVLEKKFPNGNLGFKLKDESGEFPNGGGVHGWGWLSSRDAALLHVPSYTTDPAASDALEDAILKKLNYICYQIYQQGGMFVMRVFCHEFGNISVSHPDKKICRALFAKQIFSK